MEKTLILCEKPDIGRDIAKVLPGEVLSTKDGVIRKGDYIITWAYGHLLTLKEPEDYNEKFKEWKLEHLPIFFENWKQKPGVTYNKKPGQMTKTARVKQIGQLLKEADLVIHAGDVDDEGQALIDELLRWHNYKGPVKRLDTSDLNEGALRKALTNMDDNKLHENEGWAAYARSVADLAIGVNMSRYFTLQNDKTTLTVGRVQTPTLGLVVNRDAIIENHIKTVFYELYASIDLAGKNIECRFEPSKDDPALTDGKVLQKAYLEGKKDLIDGKTFTNVLINKAIEKEAPPLPFNLVKLQSYCGSHFGYSPSDVMEITQSLREKHKAITYNRSDCQYLSDEHYKEAPDVIKVVTSNLEMNPNQFDSSIKSKCFNTANITAHFAIIPTVANVNINSFTEKERNVYTAVAIYYLAQFMPLAIKEKTVLRIDLGNGECLKATSTIVKEPGYLALLKNTKKDKAENEQKALSNLNNGNYSATF